jgi:hypothetical protein
VNWLLTGVWVVLVFDAGFLVGSWWATRRGWWDEPDSADLLHEHRVWRELAEDEPA